MSYVKTPKLNLTTLKKRLDKYLFGKGFTILETVIVVMILVIMATVAFSSYIGYSGKARDGIRISDLSNLKVGLTLYKSKGGVFPRPEGNTLTGIISGKNIVYKGEVRENIGKLANLSKTPLDPLTKGYYIYGVSYNYKFFQIGATLEKSEDTTYLSPLNLLFFEEKLHAEESEKYKNYFARVVGNYPGYIKFSTGGMVYVTNFPSLIFNFSGSSNFSDNLITSTGIYFVVDRGINFPYKLNNDVEINKSEGNELLRNFLNNSNATLTGINVTNIANGTIQTNLIFTGEILNSFGYDIGLINKLIGTNNNSNSSGG